MEKKYLFNIGDEINLEGRNGIIIDRSLTIDKKYNFPDEENTYYLFKSEFGRKHWFSGTSKNSIEAKIIKRNISINNYYIF